MTKNGKIRDLGQNFRQNLHFLIKKIAFLAAKSFGTYAWSKKCLDFSDDETSL